MELSSLLSPERIDLDLKARKKTEVLREIVAMVKRDDGAESLLQTLIKREELGSTGIGKGIAIPHGRSLLVERLEMAVGRSTAGIDFDSIDGKPAHLFFLIVAPPQDRGNQYLITLGRVAMVCQELAKKKRLFEPKTPHEFIEVVKSLEDRIR